MYSNRTRIALFIMSIIFSIFAFWVGKVTYGILLLISAVLFVYGHYRYGTVFSAFLKIRANKINEAKKLLNSIKNPELLNKKFKSYYYLANGIVKFNDMDFDAAEQNLNKAIELKPSTSQDVCFANIGLAEIYLRRGDKIKANMYLENAMKIPHHPRFNETINKLKFQIEGNHK